MGVSIPLLATKAALFDYCRDDAWKAEEWKKHYGEMLQGTPHSSDYLCHLLVSPTSSEGEDSRLRVPPMAITTISPVMNKCDAALLDIVHATVNICNNASVKSEWQWHDVASDQLAQLSTDGETAVVALGVWTRKVKVPVENYVFGKVPSREVAMCCYVVDVGGRGPAPDITTVAAQVTNPTSLAFLLSDDSPSNPPSDAPLYVSINGHPSIVTDHRSIKAPSFISSLDSISCDVTGRHICSFRATSPLWLAPRVAESVQCTQWSFSMNEGGVMGAGVVLRGDTVDVDDSQMPGPSRESLRQALAEDLEASIESIGVLFALHPTLPPSLCGYDWCVRVSVYFHMDPHGREPLSFINAITTSRHGAVQRLTQLIARAATI